MRTPLLALAASLLIAAIAGCATRQATPARPALVNHVVFFKLKNPGDTAELIADCDTRAPRIPGVVSYYCGRHVDIGRPTVDSDYDVGFFVGFNSLEAYRRYVDHPDHVWLVQKWRPRWEWIRVYDILDQTP